MYNYFYISYPLSSFLTAQGIEFGSDGVIWKKTVMAYDSILPQHLYRGSGAISPRILNLGTRWS